MAINSYSLLSRPVGFNVNVYPNSPVIYKIQNEIDGKVYIGSTLHFRKRMSEHYCQLNRNKHHSLYLQNSFNKYGVDSFNVYIIENCTLDILHSRELFWITQFNSTDRLFGYNIVECELIPSYGPRSEQHKANISRSLTGRKLTLTTKTNMSNSRIGRFKGKDSFVSRPVIQYDKKGNYIQEFNTITEASLYTGISRTGINNNLSGLSKSSGNYIWTYKIKL